MKSITQDAKYRQSLISFCKKYGVSKTSRRYNKCRSYVYFWLNRYDGTLDSLECRSRRPHSHPNQHTKEEIKMIENMRRRNPNLGMMEFWYRLRLKGYSRRPESLYRTMVRLGYYKQPRKKKKSSSKPYEQMQYAGQRVQVDVKFVPRCCIAAKGEKYYQYTAIDEFSRIRYLDAFEEHSTFSSATFLKNAIAFFRKHGVTIECIQTDNGFEFTNRFANTNRDLPTIFQNQLKIEGITHKLIRPYTPRHNGKVERSHREDQKRFYNCHSFYSFTDFKNQLGIYLKRSNQIPMRPLNYLSPLQFVSAHTVQYV